MQYFKILILPALVAGILVLAACSPKVVKPVAASEKPATAPVVHYSEAQLAEGKTIYTSSCGRCHKLFVPAQKPLSKWEDVLPRMVKRAKLNADQAALVRGYIMANLN